MSCLYPHFFLLDSKNQAGGINGTSINISEYMNDKLRQYTIQLQASFGNSSSDTVNIPFTPYRSSKLYFNFIFHLNMVLIFSERKSLAFVSIIVLWFSPLFSSSHYRASQVISVRLWCLPEYQHWSTKSPSCWWLLLQCYTFWYSLEESRR